MGFGPDVLRQPAGPLPSDPADDAKMPPLLQALKNEAGRRLAEWTTTGSGLISSSLYDAAAWFSTGLGDAHTHDAQLAFSAGVGNAKALETRLRIDAKAYFGNPDVCGQPSHLEFSLGV
jgi:choline dehydrogenase